MSLIAGAIAFAGPVFADNYDFDAMRASAGKYKNVEVALAEGYIPDPSGKCISAEGEGLPQEWGGMGIHYLRPDLLKLSPPGDRVDGAGTHTDFMAPAILLYEPQADGALELVGIENLVFEASWMSNGHAGPPMMNGRAWDHMMDDPNTSGDEAHGFMPHFDQHVWLFRKNPSGDLMPFNPTVTCEHHRG
ncbi:hypothetical protein [Roseovarius sp.]|uniref:hypothetical protein n=1 Tax=Roseovarius sp. TaxID=1486281 RepID=UPI0026399CB3|nr:hypothetical protein [Roseovarius sp.]